VLPSSAVADMQARRYDTLFLARIDIGDGTTHLRNQRASHMHTERARIRYGTSIIKTQTSSTIEPQSAHAPPNIPLTLSRFRSSSSSPLTRAPSPTPSLTPLSPALSATLSKSPAACPRVARPSAQRSSLSSRSSTTTTSCPLATLLSSRA